MNTCENKSKILIVDDISINIEKMTEVLKTNKNYLIAAASNGRTALTKAKASQFDLILLDIIMPDIDGFEVCEQLKKYTATKDIPIIFLTAKRDPKSIVKGFKVGAVDYIPKPFSDEELLARVDMHLKLKHTQDDLKRAKNLAEAAAHAKSMFLVNMSHEIRTPMNGIIGMVDILKQTKLNDSQKEFIDIIDISGENLLSIINDILDFSKIEAGQIEFENIKFNISNEICEVIKLLNLKTKEKGLSLTMIIHDSVPEFVYGDPVRLKQILINLINNAIKFTSEGGVKIEIITKNIDELKVKILFKVIDTGIGISEVGKKKLFKSFSQTDSSTTRKYGGTGLGLAISKNLTNLMNGEIGVESEVGKGSTFWFTAVFKRAFEEVKKPQALVAEEEKEIKPEKQLKILVAEDNIINQKVAVFNIEKLGHKVNIAENGKIAFDNFKKNKYDLIFMDIQMPEMDGIEATKLIREFEVDTAKDKKMPIIAMTANVMKGDREKFIEAGMNDYIGKPFKINELSELIDKIMSSEIKIS